jgi:hypothetical protein
MGVPEDKVPYLRYIWHTLTGLVYLVVVIGVLSVATTRFETLVLAGLIQLYAAVLYNFTVNGVATHAYNCADFVRFRTLAAAQGITENEDGTFEEQRKALADETGHLCSCAHYGTKDGAVPRVERGFD